MYIDNKKKCDNNIINEEHSRVIQEDSNVLISLGKCNKKRK